MMATIYIVSQFFDGDSVSGEPVACFSSNQPNALEKANAFCLEHVRGLVASDEWENIEDWSTSDLAHWSWCRAHQQESAFVTRLEVRE
jgi:hypothetical protein